MHGEAEGGRDLFGGDDGEAAVQGARELLFGIDGEGAFAVFEGDFGDGHGRSSGQRAGTARVWAEAEGGACLADGALGVVAGVVLVLARLLEVGDEALGLGAATELVFDVGPVPVGLGEFAPGGVLRALVAADGRGLLWRRQVGEPLRPDGAAVVRGPDDRGVVALGLLVAEAREPHHPGHVGDRGIAAVVAGEPPHGVLGGLGGPGARVGVPDDLVVLAGRADDGCRRRKAARVHVGEDLLEGVRAVLVQVELEAADFEHVGLLAGPGVRTDGVHGHEDVVPRRVEVAQEPLVAGARGRCAPSRRAAPPSGPARAGRQRRWPGGRPAGRGR